MQPASLTSLPPELLLHIFTQLSSIRDLNSLRFTCHATSSTFSSNAPAINRTVLPHLISCPKAANALVVAQHPTLRHLPPEEAAHLRNVHLISNARVASLVLNAFAFQARNPTDAPTSISPTEAARFERAFYRVWESIRMTSRLDRMRLDNASLQRTPLRALYLIHQVGNWLRQQFFTGKFHLTEEDLEKGLQKPGNSLARLVGRAAFRDFATWHWRDCNVHAVWTKRIHDATGSTQVRRPRGAQENWWGVWDEWQGGLDVLGEEEAFE